MYTYPEAVNAFESLANEFLKTLAPNRKFHVQVTPDAHCTTASVSWDVNSYSYHNRANISLPVRPATARLTQVEFEDWTSYILHEIGHPAFTDKSVWAQAVAAGLGSLVNALEDVRMEKAVIACDAIPNAKRVLSRLLDRKVAEARANGWKPNSRREFPWTVAVLGRAANGYDIDASWARQQLIPGSTVSKLVDWVLPELDGCASTLDVLELAKRIEKVLAEPKKPQPQGQQGQGQPQKADSPQEAQQDGQGNSDDEEASDTEETEKRTSQAPKASEGPSEENETDEASDSVVAGDEAAGDSDEAPVSGKELIERELAPKSDDVPGELSDRNQTVTVVEILRKALASPKAARAYETGGRAYASELRAAAAKSSKQRALLARALKANETEDYEGGRRSGRLDRGALCRAVAGSQNVFGRREISEGFDTDVHVLVDASGSMCGIRMEAAVEAALIVAQAAASVGAAYTVESFASKGHVQAGPVASRSAPDVTKFCRMVRDAEGGTPLSPNIARAAIQQAQRAPQKRRVMFIITDGSCDYGPAAVKSIADYVERTYGTVLAHVSIHSRLMGAFKAEVMVPYNGSIAEVGLDHFVKVLQGL